jgi:hypothetical protein
MDGGYECRCPANMDLLPQGNGCVDTRKDSCFIDDGCPDDAGGKGDHSILLGDEVNYDMSDNFFIFFIAVLSKNVIENSVYTLKTMSYTYLFKNPM